MPPQIIQQPLLIKRSQSIRSNIVEKQKHIAMLSCSGLNERFFVVKEGKEELHSYKNNKKQNNKNQEKVKKEKKVAEKDIATGVEFAIVFFRFFSPSSSFSPRLVKVKVLTFFKALSTSVTRWLTTLALCSLLFSVELTVTDTSFIASTFAGGGKQLA